MSKVESVRVMVFILKYNIKTMVRVVFKARIRIFRAKGGSGSNPAGSATLRPLVKSSRVHNPASFGQIQPGPQPCFLWSNPAGSTTLLPLVKSSRIHNPASCGQMGTLSWNRRGWSAPTSRWSPPRPPHSTWSISVNTTNPTSILAAREH